MKPPAANACIHCGAPVPAKAADPRFCCAGCQFVYGLLQERGLDGFYQMRDQSPAPPQASVVFHARDFRWLDGLLLVAETAPGAVAELDLELQGISCAGCVWLVERLFSELPGALSARVDSTAGRVSLRWEKGKCDVAAFARDLQKFGYLLGPGGVRSDPPMRALTRRLGVTAALAMNTMLFSLPRYLGIETGSDLARFFDASCFALATASLLVGGGYFIRRAWRSVRAGYLHIDLPIALGLLVAYAGSTVAWRMDSHDFAYFDFVAVFAFLMLGGRWIQQRAVVANRAQILRLGLQPGPVHRMDADSAGRQVQATDLKRDDIYRIAPGDPVPVRSRLRSGRASIGLSWINGEPEPRLFHEGGILPSGATNLGPGELELEALEPWPDSQLARLLRIEVRPEARNPLAERVIRAYLIVVLLLASAGFFVWWLAGAGLMSGLQVLISVLVVSCPCAAGVALPLADELAVARLRRSGVYVKVADFWQRLARVKKILFDKTGTLTLETLAVANPDAVSALADEERAMLLHLVSESLHPVSACLRETLLAAGVKRPGNLPAAREETGFGIACVTPPGEWRLGRGEWVNDGAESTTDGDTAFARDGVLLARFRFVEALRPDAAEQIGALSGGGFPVYLLSGDRQEKVDAMTRQLGVPTAHGLGGLSPSDKADWVREHAAEDGLMIGDGANDSLAFDRALVRGTPAVDRGLLEQKADFYFLGRSLTGVGDLFRVARTRRRAARTVFGFALIYNVGAIGAALAGWMNPLVAAIIMPLSSLVSIGLVLGVMRSK